VLKDLFHLVNWTELLLAGFTAVFGGLAIWYRKKIAAWRKFWHNAITGLACLPDLREDVRGIRYYVTPNGGGSLMDSAKRTEAAVAALGEQVDLMLHTVMAENDADDELGRFHSAATGENTYVNQLYARWLGVGKTELLGWNFLNFIHPDDVHRVRAHWDACRSEHRQYRQRHRMVDAEGGVFHVEVVATPIPETGPAKRWVGVIRRIDNDRGTEG
jgi:PAS domain S-box-containing protein